MKSFISKRNERNELVHSRMSAGKARGNTLRFAAEREPNERLRVQGLAWGVIPFIGKIVNIMFLLSIIFFLFSCYSIDLSEKEVIDIKLILYNSDGNIVNAVIPGSSYLIRAEVYTAEGKVLKNDSIQKKVDFTVIDSSFSIKTKSFSGLSVKSVDSTDFYLGRRNYSILVHVGNNSYSGRNFVWPVDWNNIPMLDYKGLNGFSGKPGLDGKDAFSKDPDLLDGGDGANGKRGGPGKSSSDSSFLIFLYDVEGMQISNYEYDVFLIIYDTIHEKIYFASPEQLTIYANGGKGGDGGQGGDAGKPVEYTRIINDNGTNILEIKTGEPGRFGLGGDGGNGGKGGNVIMYSTDSLILEYVSADVSGGLPGLPGKSGKNENDTIMISKNGREGWNGSSGTITEIIISYEEMLSLLDPLFKDKILEIERVVLQHL